MNLEDQFAPIDERAIARAKAPQSDSDAWRPITPTPEDAPRIGDAFFSRRAPDGFAFKRVWTYRDEASRLLGYVERYERPANGLPAEKQIRPFTFCENDKGRREWRCKGFPEPRPLYGLDQLAAHPEAPVIVCEGEKAADAAARLLPGFVAVTSMNGAKSPSKSNWSLLAGRRVTIWPDNDEPGAAYARIVAELAIAAGAASVAIVDVPDEAPEGADAADCERAGGSPNDAAEMVAGATLFVPLKSVTTKSGNWPVPKPLPSGLVPVPPFNLEYLPRSIAPWVDDIAERTQCPLEFVAIPALVALGATLGRKVGIRPQRHTDWIEAPNLWGCVIGRPGAMKSPAATEALKPLQRLEMNARKESEAARKEYEREMWLNKIKKDVAASAARAAVKKGGDAPPADDIEEPEEPKSKRYVTNDTTYEALGEILADNPNGLLAYRDELVSLLKTLDREEYAAARGFFLTAWNGTGGYTFDRIIRGRTHIEAACLSLLGGTQPGRFAEYVRRAIAGGAGDDGLIQRFGLLVWPDQSPEWRGCDRYPLKDPRQVAWRTFEGFDGFSPERFGAERDDFDALPFLRFDEAAQGVFGEWRAHLEKRLRSGEMSPAFESHLAKYRKLIPSLALINHLADGGHGPVTEEATLRALAFSEYLEAHARRAYASGSEAETTTAKAILKRILHRELVDGFTLRDIHQKDWANLTDREQVKAGLDWLAANLEKTGGRNKTTYAINPGALL